MARISAQTRTGGKARRSRKRSPNRKLQELRINAGLTPNGLAHEAATTGNTIRMVEAGQVPNPRIQLQIARVFDLQPVDLWPLDL